MCTWYLKVAKILVDVHQPLVYMDDNFCGLLVPNDNAGYTVPC